MDKKTTVSMYRSTFKKLNKIRLAAEEKNGVRVSWAKVIEALESQADKKELKNALVNN